MKVIVYALTNGTSARISARGIMNERLRSVRVAGISAIVGQVRTFPKASEARLRKFAGVIARLAGARPALLPVRYGTTLDDEAELRLILAARAAALRRQLSHVRGRVQMTVRVMVAATAGDGKREAGRISSRTRGSGAAYLNERAARQQAKNIPGFAPLHAAVARWVKDERVERHGPVATVYHLIPARSATRYADAIEKAALASGARGFVTGPWPVYAFADSW